VGSTGITTSSHLHYEVSVKGKAVNPRTYILPESVRH
jgi:murein DD-endopeptidase MepM/ murein hydrolase activator NlpD